jgi:carbamoyl-phosphate synthase/aspartate carbamoyltransferase
MLLSGADSFQYLETLGGDSRDMQKTEYSLTQHLAKNMIDMYINLPSKNHYRRPATYASKGYRTRRLAVDFAVPLITNVKVAKLLVEALVRRMPLDISAVDYQTSHTTHTFPGLNGVTAHKNYTSPGFINFAAFHRRHILSVKQFNSRDVHELFSVAHEMQLQVERNGTLDILKGKILCTLFYEPSTRTSASFDAAMKRCGGEVMQVAADMSSVMKGETLEDTVRTLGCYADAIVLRHPVVGSAQLAAKFSPVPVLNAGDGIGEHPTQACTSLTCLFLSI